MSDLQPEVTSTGEPAAPVDQVTSTGEPAAPVDQVDVDRVEPAAPVDHASTSTGDAEPLRWTRSRRPASRPLR